MYLHVYACMNVYVSIVCICMYCVCIQIRVYWIYMHIHTIHTYTCNKCLYIQYIHIHIYTCIYMQYIQYIQYIHWHTLETTREYDTYIYMQIHTYTYIYIHIHANTILVCICMYLSSTIKIYMQIHPNTCNRNIKIAILTFLNHRSRWYVLCIYLLVFASIFVSICTYLVSICKYCIYLLVSMRLATLCALNTCKYLQYLQILTEILADTYTKYLQIRANTSK